MAYFLKKTNNKKGTYLQIYESFYDPKRRQTAHKSYKPIGYVHELIEKGIDDPIAYYKSEVSKLDEEFHAEKNVKKVQKIANCIWLIPTAGFAEQNGRNAKLNGRITFDY